MIRLRQIRKTYRMGETDVLALRGVDLDIAPGEYIAIMGPSGSGKSTLMHILGLLDQPDSGTLELFGKETSKLDDDSLAAARARLIGFVFQQFNLLPRLTARENVALPLIYTGGRGADDRADALLKTTGLGDRTGHRPSELSGGQQQRVAIARALANAPRVVLADEPTGNLDSRSAAEIMDVFDGLNAQGITVILVTHEEDIAARARRVIRLRDGAIVSDQRREKEKVRSSEDDDPWKGARGGRFHPREVASHFQQAGRALVGNKTRTLLSMLGVLIGVAAVIAMLALGQGGQRTIEKQLASLGSNLLSVRPGGMRMHGVALEAGAVTRFRPADIDAVRSIADVNKVSGTVQGQAQVTYGGKNWRTQVIGTLPAYADMRASKPAFGRFFTDEENQSRSRVAVIGLTIVKELFDGRDPIGDVIKINRVSFQVVGILPAKGSSGWRDEDDAIIIPLETAMRRLLGKEYLDSIDIEVTSTEAMPEVEQAVDELLRRRHRVAPENEDAFQIRNLAEIQAALSQTSRTMSLLLAIIAAISLIVGGIGIMNIMLVSVTERTREIGIRKAIGARRRDVLAQFLIESVTVSLAGGGIGVALGYGTTVALARAAGWPTEVTPSIVGMAFLFSTAIGIVFGFWPARKAAGLHPVDALRYE
jgi:macrolide transport system ATP-binding/permease protein